MLKYRVTPILLVFLIIFVSFPMIHAQTSTPTPTPIGSIPTPAPTPMPTPYPASEATGIASETLTLPLFLQASVSVSFAPSLNKTTTTSPSFGGIYYDSGSNGMYTIQMPGLDVYNIQVQVQYGQWVSQTVVISIVSGNQTDASHSFQINWPMNSMGFDLNLQVSTLVFPMIPTADQNAAAMMTQFKSQINNMTLTYQTTSSNQTNVVEFTVIFAIVGTFLGIIAIVFNLNERAKRVRLEERVRLERGQTG
jgi:hypothetical protein